LYSKEKQPKGILNGFNSFCNHNNIESKVIDSLENIQPKEGELYIVLNDRDLIRIIKKIKKTNLVLSEDIGVISYNDTMLKEIIEDGITTISTDFNLMGKKLAEMILNKEQISVENPCKLILRKSM
jgi:DNA-binding LacI/PurR family transcriptional regulator